MRDMDALKFERGQTECANCGQPVVPARQFWKMDGKYPVHLTCPSVSSHSAEADRG